MRRDTFLQINQKHTQLLTLLTGTHCVSQGCTRLDHVIGRSHTVISTSSVTDERTNAHMSGTQSNCGMTASHRKQNQRLWQQRRWCKWRKGKVPRPARRHKVITITQNTDIPAVRQEYHLLIPYLIDKSSVQKAAWSWSPNFSLGRVDRKLVKLYKRTKDAETNAATKSPTEPLLILLLVNRPAPQLRYSNE